MMSKVEFRLASGLDGKPGAVQVNALVYQIGYEADDILVGFGFTKDEKELFASAIFERAMSRRCQEEGEMVDSYIT